MASWLERSKPVEDAAPTWLANAKPVEVDERKPTIAETAIEHAANGLALGAAPKLRGLYAAGEGTGAEIGNPLVTASDVLAGLWRKLRGDPEAEERYEQAKAEEKKYLDETRAANPKTAMLSELVGGAAPAAALASVAPVAKGSGLLSRAASGASQGATVGLGYGLGSGESAGDVLTSTGGGALGGATAPLIGAGLRAITDPMRDYIARKLATTAETAALKATGATQVDFKRLARENPSRPQTVGRALLEEPGISLRSPGAIRSGAKAARSGYGSDVGSIVSAADKGGAGVDVANLINRVKTEVIDPISANPMQMAPGHHGAIVNPTADRLSLFLGEIAKQAQGGKLTIAQAHQARQQLDEFLRGVRRAADPESTVLKSAANDIRKILSDEMGNAIGAAGLGGAWSAANRGYSAMADAAKLAQKGVERAEGNNNPLFSLTSTIYGSGGAAAGAAVAGPVGAALGGAAASGARAAAIKYGNPAAARVTDRLSKVLATNPTALGQHAAQLQTMAANRGPQGLAAAHYVLSQTSPDYRLRWQSVAAEGEEGETP